MLCANAFELKSHSFIVMCCGSASVGLSTPQVGPESAAEQFRWSLE